MKVGIFYVELGQPLMKQLVNIAISHVKAHMNCEIVQFTTPQAPKINANLILRRNADQKGLMEARIDHFAHHDGAWLFIDPDVVVQEDVSNVFEQEFDVAMVKRDKLTLEGKDVAKDMPFNTGVIFSRNTRFWKDVLQEMKEMSLDDRNWFGDQIAVGKVAKSGKYKVLELPTTYNFTPKTAQQDILDKKIVHYKGDRKKWMIKRSIGD